MIPWRLTPLSVTLGRTDLKEEVVHVKQQLEETTERLQEAETLKKEVWLSFLLFHSDAPNRQINAAHGLSASASVVCTSSSSVLGSFSLSRHHLLLWPYSPSASLSPYIRAYLPSNSFNHE